MLKAISIFFSVIILYSCSGNYEENQKKLDQIYGECDNPTKRIKLSDVQYKDCKAKERAKGGSFFNLEGDFNDLIGGKSSKVIYASSVNDDLWSASLELTSKYPLKIADNQGGFLETDWIVDKENQDKRCLIKIQITSSELISTGVSTNFICENKENNNWVSDDQKYFSEEKQITLKILEIASKISDTKS